MIDRANYKRLVAIASEKKFKEKLEFLRTTQSLGSLPEAQIKQLAEALDEKQYNKGDVVITQGDAGDAFYIIKSGIAPFRAQACRCERCVGHSERQSQKRAEQRNGSETYKDSDRGRGGRGSARLPAGGRHGRRAD